MLFDVLVQPNSAAQSTLEEYRVWMDAMESIRPGGRRLMRNHQPHGAFSQRPTVESYKAFDTAGGETGSQMVAVAIGVRRS